MHHSHRALVALVVTATACDLGGAGDHPAIRADVVTYQVRPYYVFPSDQRFHQAYADAVLRATRDIQDWYGRELGKRFDLLGGVNIVQGPDYLTMRCGSQPDPQCAGDPSRTDAWWEAVSTAVGGREPGIVKWVFSQGGGGFAAGAQLEGASGLAITGDWVLEPLSGEREPAGFDCSHDQVGFCRRDFHGAGQGGDAPMGTAAHELGHALGLNHPPPVELQGEGNIHLLMGDHTWYPDVHTLANERLVLVTNPQFGAAALAPDAPNIDIDWHAHVPGTHLAITGKDLGSIAARVWFVAPARIEEVPIDTRGGDDIGVTIPNDAASGLVQVLTSDGRTSNARAVTILQGVAPNQQTFPVVFDQAQHRVHWAPSVQADSLDTTLAVYNPNDTTADVWITTTREDGSRIGESWIQIAPKDTFFASSLGDALGGPVFAPATTGYQRFSLTLMSYSEIHAQTFVFRSPGTGVTLGGSHPFQLTTMNPIRVADMAKRAVFPQMLMSCSPDGGNASTNSYDSEAYLYAPPGPSQSIHLVLACPDLLEVWDETVPGGGVRAVRPRDHVPDPGARRCRCSMTATSTKAFAGTALWAGGGSVAVGQVNGLLSYNAPAAGTLATVRTRLMWNAYNEYNGGVTIFNDSDLDVDAMASIAFPLRSDGHQDMPLGFHVASQTSAIQYFGSNVAGVPAPTTWNGGEGSVEIAANEPVVALVNVDNRVHGGAWTNVAATYADSGRIVHFPGVANRAPAPWLRQILSPSVVLTSGITLENVADRPVTCTVEVHTSRTITVTRTLAAGQAFVMYLPGNMGGNYGIPTGDFGSATARCDDHVVGWTSVRVERSADDNAPIDGDGISELLAPAAL